MMERPSQSRAIAGFGILLFVLLVFHSREALAVVGYAEKYDEFKEEDLTEFHRSVLLEEQSTRASDAEGLELLDRAALNPGEEEEVDPEILKMRRELLQVPDRDRFKAGLDGQYTYDSNIGRRPFEEEKGDSVFDIKSFAEVDFGGKKTDLRFELRGAKEWNVQFPTSDFWLVEERIRYRRKYFRKLTHSIQSRIARTSSKTIEVNEKRIRWDSHQNTTMNYALSRKFSINTELEGIKRLYTTEPFDQDSQWEVKAAPGIFWHITPKSRVAMGYTFGANRIRSKAGDTNSHELHASYFGKVTRKSSISFDLAYQRQTPRSLESEKSNSYTVGTGYIFQMTPKTQLTFQWIRQFQNSSSNQVGGSNQNAVTKQDTHFVNDNMSISLNSRFRRKLQAGLTLSASHLNTRVERGGDEDLETLQWTFPVQATMTYLIKRWIQLRFGYTFTFRTGNEENDRFRSHLLYTGLNLYY